MISATLITVQDILFSSVVTRWRQRKGELKRNSSAEKQNVPLVLCRVLQQQSVNSHMLGENLDLLILRSGYSMIRV